MANNTKGRRAAAEELNLLDARERHAANGRTVRRNKLPSDGAIATAMIRRLFRWIFRLVAFFFIASIALVVIYRVVDPPITPLMLIRPMEGVAGGDLVGVNKRWVSLDDISPAMVRAVIAAEDGRFFTHSGIDWKAVESARQRNERSDGKKLYGASTITMQCARNVFLWQGRNYIRKGLEVYFTYLIEFVWGKRRILEVYLNVIEWGDGVYGVEAASEKYFGIHASQLSARQAALLASVLPNPRHWDPSHPTGYINRRASMIQSRAAGVGLGPIKEDARRIKRSRDEKNGGRSK